MSKPHINVGVIGDSSHLRLATSLLNMRGAATLDLATLNHEPIELSPRVVELASNAYLLTQKSVRTHRGLGPLRPDAPTVPTTTPIPVDVPDMTEHEATLPEFKRAMDMVAKTCAAQDKRLRKAARRVGEELVDATGLDLGIR